MSANIFKSMKHAFQSFGGKVEHVVVDKVVQPLAPITSEAIKAVSNVNWQEHASNPPSVPAFPGRPTLPSLQSEPHFVNAASEQDSVHITGLAMHNLTDASYLAVHF